MAFLFASGGLAQTSTTEAAAARSLFDQAKSLMAAGKYSEACAKFEESQRLSPGIGTQFNLANCYEKLGKTASAWTLFLRVASEANLARQPEREQAARRRADTLSGALCKISLEITQPYAEGLEVFLDDVPVRQPLWGESLPIDPGTHTLRASAAGHASFQHRFEINPTNSPMTIRVPTFAPEEPAKTLEVTPKANASSLPSPAAPHVAEPPARLSTARDTHTPPSTFSVWKIAGIAGIGAGSTAVMTSIYLALRASDLHDEGADRCRDDCDPVGKRLQQQAVSDMRVATGIGIVGFAVLAGGTTILLLDGRNRTQRSAKLSLGLGYADVSMSW